MKNNEIMQKISTYKETMVNLQIKLNKIEKKVNGKDADRFGFYKPLIESGLEDLDSMLFNLELSIESICSMVDGGCAFGKLEEEDIDTMVAEAFEYSEKHIKPVVREINENMKKIG